MTRHSLVVAAALALLVAGCGRGDRDKGQASEQQRSDLDEAAKMVEGNQTIVLDDDSLKLNDSEAQATLNEAAPGNTASPGNMATPVAPAAPGGNTGNQAPPR